MIRKTGIKVTFSPTRYGAYTARPVSRVWRRRFAEYMSQWMPAAIGDLSEAFFQGYWELPEEITQHRSAMRELDAGWDVTILVDPWIYGHFLGWDAHTVTEGRI